MQRFFFVFIDSLLWRRETVILGSSTVSDITYFGSVFRARPNSFLNIYRLKHLRVLVKISMQEDPKKSVSKKISRQEDPRLVIDIPGE